MEERRKNKRLDLDVTVQLERLDTEDMTTLKYVRVDVTLIACYMDINLLARHLRVLLKS